MPLAFNDSGDATYFDEGSKSWKPAPVAKNEKGDKLYYDGKAWNPAPAKAMSSLPSPMTSATAMPGTASAATSPAFRGTSADPGTTSPAGPSQPQPPPTFGGEMKKAAGSAFGLPGALATGAVKGADLARTAAFAGGEYVGAGMKGASIMAPTLAAIGASSYDALTDFYENWKNGTPIPPDSDKLIKTFGINFLTSAFGNFLTSGVPSEAKAIGERAGEAETAHTRAGVDLTAEGQKLMEKLADVQQSQLGEVSPAAQIEAIQQITGRTAKTAEEARRAPTEATSGGSMVPTPEELERQGGVRGAYFGAKRRIGQDLGGQIGAFRQQVKDVPVSDFTDSEGNVQSGLSDLQNTIAQQTGYRDDYLHTFSPAVAKLYSQAKKIAGMTLTDEEQKTLFGTSKKTFLDRPGELGQRSEAAEMEATGEDEITPKAKKSSTLGNIVALKAKAARLSVVSHEDVHAYAAEQLDKAAERILDRQVPPNTKTAWDRVKSQYANYKQTFLRPDGQKMQRTSGRDAAADQIFNHPNLNLAKRVVENAKPEELKALRDGIGDWAQNNPDKVLVDTSNRNLAAKQAEDRAYIWGKLFPGNRYAADPKSTLFVSATADNIEASPIQKANWERAFQQAQEKAIKDAAPKVMDWGLKFADEIGGPVGDDYRKQIETAFNKGKIENGAQMAADKALSLYTGFTNPDGSFNRQAFIQDLASEQPRFGASVAKKNTAKIYIQRIATTPELTPVLGAAGALNELVTGRPGFWGLMGAASAPFSARRFITNGWFKSLAKPEATVAFLNTTKGAKIGVMTPLAEASVKGFYDNVASALIKKLAGVTPEPEPKKEDEEAGGAEAAR